VECHGATAATRPGSARRQAGQRSGPVLPFCPHLPSRLRKRHVLLLATGRVRMALLPAEVVLPWVSVDRSSRRPGRHGRHRGARPYFSADGNGAIRAANGAAESSSEISYLRDNRSRAHMTIRAALRGRTSNALEAVLSRKCGEATSSNALLQEEIQSGVFDPSIPLCGSAKFKHVVAVVGSGFPDVGF